MQEKTYEKIELSESIQTKDKAMPSEMGPYKRRFYHKKMDYVRAYVNKVSPKIKEKLLVLYEKLKIVIKSNFFIGFATVFLANALFLSGIETTLDLTIGEDALNLINAFNEKAKDIFNSGANSGYLYTIYLKIVAITSENVADAYYFNIFFLSMFSTIMIYVYSFVITKKTINSILFAFVWLICCFNVSLYEKGELFALIFILAGFLCVEYAKSNSMKWIVLNISLFFASYISEVYFIPFVITFVIAMASLVFNIKTKYKEISVFMIFVLVLMYANSKGLPLISDKEASFIRSFKECFFMNWQDWQEITASQLYDEGYKDQVWLENFGDTENIFKAFLASPLTILHHLFTNFINTIRVIGVNLFYHYPIFAPTNSYRAIVVEGMTAIIIFTSLLGGAIEHFKSRATVIKNHGYRMSLWAITLISPIVSGIVFYPYPYYVVQIGCFLLIFGGIFVTELLSNMEISFIENKKALLIFCFCVLCIVPRVYTMPPQTDILVNPSRIFGKSYSTLPIKETVGFINSLNIKSKMSVYSIEEGYINYLPKNYQKIDLPKDGFKQSLKDKSIDMVIETSGFSTSPKDKELIKFLKNPEKYGYFFVSVPGFSENRVIIREGVNCSSSYCKNRVYPKKTEIVPEEKIIPVEEGAVKNNDSPVENKVKDIEKSVEEAKKIEKSKELLPVKTEKETSPNPKTKSKKKSEK